MITVKSRGFTLIELLVVIAIIGLLASVVLASLNSARVKGRDARRVSDMKELQNALELYFGNHNAYPILTTPGTTNAGFQTALAGLVSDGDISVIATDPGSNVYYYLSNATGQFYCLGAKMEGTAPASSCNTASLGATISTANYTVGP